MSDVWSLVGVHQQALFAKPKKMFIDLNEAEELFRNLYRDNPDEFERISQLRDGIRSAKASSAGSFYVFCQAGRYQQLFLLGPNGEIKSRDITRILGAIKAASTEKAPTQLSRSHNENVMKVKTLFAEEVKHRNAQRDRSVTLSSAPKYVLHHLRILFSTINEEDQKGQINILEKAFRLSPTAAIRRELNRLRRNGVEGQSLFRNLTDLFHQHRLSERLESAENGVEKEEIPRIICSESLI